MIENESAFAIARGKKLRFKVESVRMSIQDEAVMSVVGTLKDDGLGVVD